MTDEQRKALTLYLGEPEATSEYTVANNGDLVSVKTVIKNRTFDNRNDLLDLYEAVYEDGKWEPLYEYLRNNYLMGKGTDECISSGLKAWLICLSGKGYEERCKMIAAWIKEVKK